VRKVHEASTEIHQLLGEVRGGAGGQLLAAKHEVPAALSSVTERASSSVRDARAHITEWAPAILNRASLDSRRARASLQTLMSTVGERATQTVEAAAAGSQALIREIAGQGPQKTLARGFAVVRTSSGSTLTSAANAAAGTAIDITFSDGRLSAEVRTVETVAPDESLNPRLHKEGS
jgi:exodeoxyribonuclease VII large subunit